MRVNVVQSSRVCIEALITWGNIAAEATTNSALTFPTHPKLPPASIPSRSACVPFDHESRWNAIRPASFKLQYFVPAGTSPDGASPGVGKGPSVREQWVHWQDFARDEGVAGFTAAALPFLADAFRPLPEAYGLKGNWYPTLSYGMEVKKVEPETKEGLKGWEWLFLRLDMYQVQNGRFDLDLAIYDEAGELVALSKHTALIVSGERNIKKIEAKI